MSEVNEFEVRDYLTEARTRYTQQFKDKEVFDRYVQLLIYGNEQLQLVFKDLMQGRSLETARGVQLDQIGDIVGIKRGFLPALAWGDSYFGFADDIAARPFADLFAAVDAGIFFDLASQTEGNVTWTDELYRVFIKAKIFSNSARGTPEDLILATKSILAVTYVDLLELGNARLQIGFNRVLNPLEKYILQEVGEVGRLLPIPIGVGVEYLEADEFEFFGFDETPGALGFSSFETDLSSGYGEDYGVGYGGALGEVLVGGGYFASLF